MSGDLATVMLYMHDRFWPIVGSIGLLFLMVGVSNWLNGAGAGFWIMLAGVAVNDAVLLLATARQLMARGVERFFGDPSPILGVWCSLRSRVTVIGLDR